MENLERDIRGPPHAHRSGREGAGEDFWGSRGKERDVREEPGRKWSVLPRALRQKQATSEWFNVAILIPSELQTESVQDKSGD